MDIATLDSLRIVLDPKGQTVIAAALMLIMFGIALGLRLTHFAKLLERRAEFFAGAIAQIIGLPLITLFLVVLLSPPPSIALGMFVVACCPGGAVSNLFTWLAHGDVAYSVSLTATSSALAAFLTPTSILFWSHTYPPTSTLLQTIEFNSLAFLLQTTILLALPLVLGMLLAARAPLLAMRIKKWITFAGTLLLGAAIAYGTAKFFVLLLPALAMILTFTIIHNAAAFGTGALAGRLLRADPATRRALVIEVGIQNSGLAIVILLGQFGGLGGAAAIAAVWGIWHLVAGGIIVLVCRKLDRSRTNA